MNASPAGAEIDSQEEIDRRMAQAIGAQVRAFRNQLGLTVARVAQLTSLSPGMLSKVENGNASPSLATLHALARAFKVPMTYFFQNYQDQQGCCYVKKGGGILIEHRGSKVGHQYQLLGHGVGKDVSVAPYMIELTDKSEVFPLFQHPGVEFIHMLEGEVVYQHASQKYQLSPGDSLFFEGSTAHGPAELVRLPIRFLSVIVQPGTEPAYQAR
ncbi:MAG: helix-turn-helix domain-containing protein [Chromatiales bacterium]